MNKTILPDLPLSLARPSDLSNDALHRASRDYTTVAARCEKLAGLCRQRAKGAKTIANVDETPVFTDHAILRYLERFKGLDLDAIAAEMTATYDGGVMTSGGAIKEAGGHCFIRSPDGKIKTIIPTDWLTENDRDVAVTVYNRD